MRRLDHVVFNTRDRTDEVVALFERLGFFVTARGHHSLGSINHTVVFETDYLELLGYPVGAPPAKRPELEARPVGLMATVLRSDNADATWRELKSAGLTPRPVQAFSRPVDLEDGRHAEAAFRVTRLDPDAVPGTWFYFCQHLNPELVWRREWQQHANAACGMAAIAIDVPDIGAAAALYASCTATTAAPVNHADAVLFPLGAAELRLRQMPGGARMTGLCFAVRSLEALRARLRKQAIAFEQDDNGIVIDRSASFGSQLQFRVPAR